MVITDFDGTLVEGIRTPSSDTAAHAYVYRHMNGWVVWCTPTPDTPPRIDA